MRLIIEEVFLLGLGVFVRTVILNLVLVYSKQIEVNPESILMVFTEISVRLAYSLRTIGKFLSA